MAAMRRIFIAFSFLLLVSWTPVLGQNASMQLITSEKGWALDNRRLFWTNDDGSHWKDVTPPHQESETITDTFFLDVSHGWVLLCGEQEGENTLSFNVAYTSDSGGTWAVAPVRVPSQKPDELDGHAWLDFVDPLHGWMVLHANSSSAFSWGLLLATDDGGKNWKELAQAPIAGRPIFATPQEGWISGNGGPKGMYSTHDGGISWQYDGPTLENLPSSLPTNPSYGDMKFTDANHGFLVIYLSPATDAEEPRGTAMALYVTSDSGRTWKYDRVLIDRGALTKNVGVLSRLVAGYVIPSVSEAGSLLVAFNDRKNLNRVTLMNIAHQGEATTEGTPSTRSENVLWRPGDDIAALSFVSGARGWARTSLGDLLLTSDSGATWKNINPIPVVRPAAAPTANGPRVKAHKLGPGPSLVPQSPQAGLHYTERLGFDEHNVATVAAMGTWFSMSPFFDVGIYVGGGNYCGQKVSGKCVSRPDPGLSSLWLTQMEGQGWGFLPIWVGPQAPCVNASGYGMFTAANAASSGTSNADNAAAAMARYGLPGTVVFYDMENYTSTPGDACSVAVRAFLAAWVQEMNADGFATTAVYGNPGNAQNDFSQIAGLTEAWISITPAAGKPPAVTIWGLGAGKSYALSDSWWPQNQRAHQFLENIGSAGGGYVTYGGVNTGYSIDYDVENLLIPGAEGTKPYIWVASSITAPFPGGYAFEATGMNDVPTSALLNFVSAGQLGQIVGVWWVDDAAGCLDQCAHGFLDNSGILVAFDDPSGPEFTVPAGLNEASQTIGYYCAGADPTPHCGTTPNPTESGFVGDLTANTFKPSNFANGLTYLTGINDDGEIVGNAYSNCGTEGCPTYTPFLYFNNQFNQLYITCADDQQSIASIMGINGYGQILGNYIDTQGNNHGFFYDYENTTGIGTCVPVGLPNGSYAFAINNQGQILGSSDEDGTLWLLDGGLYYSLPSQFYNAIGNWGLNDAGQVAGAVNSGGDFCTYPPVHRLWHSAEPRVEQMAVIS
ncbi:MAG TPA: glycoside hydrolase domain-containing protein [Candidatus Dormibacteraeota bacterium]|jgi:photosystem II stability/assembly factor-like uncharacterized protein|nr:glycoside hydrolase domain-containing protein [Candidatus Dormibacteraeota bacterium]